MADLSASLAEFGADLSSLKALVVCHDLRLGGGQHAIEAAQHGHRQHDALVLWRTVGAAQQIGDLPNQVREVDAIGHPAS